MTEPQKETSEFRRGWPVVLAAMLGVGLGLSPLPFYTIGVFAPHLADAFGWSMGQIMAGVTITSLVVLFAGPAAGMLASRFGARIVAIGSTILFSLAFMSFALSSGSLVQFYVTWAVVALLGAGTLPMTWTVAVNQRFDRHKGLALGISLMGTGLFGFFSKPLLAWMIAEVGWRGAYVGMGLLPLLIAAPVAMVLFFEVDAAAQKTRATSASAPGLSLGETLRQGRFWLIALALLPISFALAGPIPNMENILREAQFSPASIVGLTAFIGLSALVGRLVGGWLLDRFWAPAVAFLILASPAASCWILAQPVIAPDAALAAICLIGFAVGVEYDLVAYLVARYFGMRAYASIYGVLYVFFSIGAGVGPLIFGWAFDQQGSYAGVLTAALVGLVASAASLLFLGRYRFGPRDNATAPSAPLVENEARSG